MYMFVQLLEYETFVCFTFVNIIGIFGLILIGWICHDSAVSLEAVAAFSVSENPQKIWMCIYEGMLLFYCTFCCDGTISLSENPVHVCFYHVQYGTKAFEHPPLCANSYRFPFLARNKDHHDDKQQF